MDKSEQEILELVEGITGCEPEPINLKTIPKGDISCKGYIFFFSETEKYEIFEKVRENLKNSGYTALIRESRHKFGTNEFSYRIIVLQDQHPANILRMLPIEGLCQYEVSTEDVAKLVENWHDEFDVEITEITYCTLVCKLKMVPEDIEPLVQQLISICPDYDSDPSGTELKDKKTIGLWWD